MELNNYISSISIVVCKTGDMFRQVWTGRPEMHSVAGLQAARPESRCCVISTCGRPEGRCCEANTVL